jgi:hypothetical protein
MSLAITRFDIQTCKLIPMLPQVEKTVEDERCSSSSTTTTASTASSIGRNSDDDGGEENEEVQSVFNEGPLDMMESLEEVLPIRRGISNFYNGKSKSFTSLLDASSSSATSMKEVAKPENAYTRRRKNLLAFNHSWEKNHRTSPYSGGSGISKRSIGTSRSTYALAVAATSSSESISNMSEDSSSSPHSTSPPLATLPPLHPNTNVSLAWRSFSVVDLRQCGIGDTDYLPRN